MMANKELLDRGSRKHVLDLVASSTFRSDLDAILAGTGQQLADKPFCHPFGRANADAWAEFEVEEYFYDIGRQIPGLPLIASDWWIGNMTADNRRPCFDLIAHLQSLEDDGLGILLVEAKAHFSEAKIKDAKNVRSASDESISNDIQIKRRISESRTALNRLRCGTFNLSCEDHYQLANRLAYSAHLAGLGYRVVLLYLGFLGDSYFDDQLTDPNHWQRVMGGYIQGVVPQKFPEHLYQFQGGGSLFMTIRSLPVAEVSARPGGSL